MNLIEQLNKEHAGKPVEVTVHDFPRDYKMLGIIERFELNGRVLVIVENEEGEDKRYCINMVDIEIISK